MRSPFPLTYFPLIFRFAWYQQAGRVGQAETEQKFVGVSGKRIRDFTLPRVTTLSITTVSIMTFSITKFSIAGLFATLSIINT
jgi:hypothetical protein